MKINCGKSRKEKRQEYWDKLCEEAKRLRQWHVKFAWFPIRIGKRECRWLEKVLVRYPKAYPSCNFEGTLFVCQGPRIARTM